MNRPDKTIQSFIDTYKMEGMDGIYKKLFNWGTGQKPKTSVYHHYKFVFEGVGGEQFVPKKIELKKDQKLVINWFMVNMGGSGGGDINIFRFVNGLAKLGHKNRVYVVNGKHSHDTNEDLRKFVVSHYGEVDAEFHNSADAVLDSDICIATEWRTAYFVRPITNTSQKFYFVQDFEPYFFPKGSEYFLAENTYKMGFVGITAGGWLKNKLHDEYGMKTFGYEFSYEKELYYEDKKAKRDNYNIFFYTRPVTLRREFELGVLALEHLYKLEPRINVKMAGWYVGDYEFHFPHEVMGGLKLNQLASLYSSCNLGFVLSATNCSLLPTELLASGCVPIMDEGPQNEWLLKDNYNGFIVNHDPIEIAKKIKYLLDNPEKVEAIRSKKSEILGRTNHEAEIKKVEEFILGVVA